MIALLLRSVVEQTPLPPLPPLPAPPQVFVGPGPPVEAFVAVVVVIVGALLLWPLVRAWARRLERGGGGADQEARGEIEALRARVAELEVVEQRVLELEERMDFSERLLTQRTGEPLRPGEDA
jgi:hypothetical protein